MAYQSPIICWELVLFERRHFIQGCLLIAAMEFLRKWLPAAFSRLIVPGGKTGDERMLTKTVLGLATRIATKMTHHGLKYLLRDQYGIDILTVQVDHNH